MNEIMARSTSEEQCPSEDPPTFSGQPKTPHIPLRTAAERPNSIARRHPPFQQADLRILPLFPPP